MWRGPPWSQSEGGSHALAERALVVPKRRTPRAHVAGASMVPNEKSPPPPATAAGASVVPNQGSFLTNALCLDGPKATEAPAPTWREPRWSQS